MIIFLLLFGRFLYSE
ncbi:hypothetical protein I6Q26_001789 [Campylobacter jejuni]|nr:hypothetical protein [Campylobacter jejuni]